MFMYDTPPDYTMVVPRHQTRMVAAGVCPAGVSDIDASRGTKRLANQTWRGMRRAGSFTFTNRTGRAVRVNLWCG